jgi:hypothetical protein
MSESDAETSSSEDWLRERERNGGFPTATLVPEATAWNCKLKQD